MAGAKGIWDWPLVAALLLSAGTAALAQSTAAGSLTGKLTDWHSAPLDGAAVTVRNEATGEEAHTTTAKNGVYRFTGLGAGEYTLEAESPQRGRGHVDGIVVIAGHEARVLTALEFEQPTVKPVQAEIHAIDPAPGARPAAPAAEPFQALLMSVRRLQELARETPATVTLAVNATIPAEPLHTLALSGRWLQRPEREMPAAVSPEVNVTLPAEPLQTLTLNAQRIQDTVPQTLASPVTAGGGTVLVPARGEGQELAAVRVEESSASPVPGGQGGASPGGQTATVHAWAGTTGLAIGDAAAAALRAAMQFTLPPPRPIQAAVHDIDPAAQAVTTTLPAEQLQALPLTGRRWQDFTLDTPAASTPAGGEAQTSLRGAGQEAPAITVDGAGRTLAFGSTGGAGQPGTGQTEMGSAWAQGRRASLGGPAMSQTAIREVQMTAGNEQAEAGRAAGGAMNVESQRGSNGLHGQGFFFDRQNNWGARNPFTQWVQETAPATEITTPVFTPEPYTPPDRELTWGVGAGGHIRRDKLFWFGALDGYQRNDPGLAMVKHPDVFFAQPSNDQMQVLSARLGLSGVNPVAEGLAAYSKMLETLDGLLGPAPRTAAQWVGFGRLDWQAAERHRFTLEGIGALWDSPGGGLARVSETYGNHSFGTSHAGEEWLLGRWKAFLTPNLLAVTQASWGRDMLSARPETPSAYEQTFLGPNVWGQLPQIVVDSRYGFTIGNPSRFGAGSYPDEHLYQGQETVDWVHGSLLVKAGFELGHNTDATSMLRNQTGTFSYSSVANFASDALVFGMYGISGQLNPDNQHNCDQTGKAWRDTSGQLRGLGNLPCYSYYSQTMGPSNWQLGANDWAGFASTQWQPNKLLVLSAGLRWEREQLPPPIAAMVNPELPLTGKLPSLGNQWGPRASLALGSGEGHWPVLRLGYGMYFGRTENATVETALTQTGSPNGDLSFFMRPTDDLPNYGGGAPPFPYVLAGEPLSVVKPGAVEFAPNFRNPEVHQGVAAIEETLPGHVELTAGALVSLGRRLPVLIDANLAPPPADPQSPQLQSITYNVCEQVPKGPDNGPCGNLGLGPIKATQITVPFYASTASTGVAGWLNPDYQQIDQITSQANSTYEAGTLKVSRYGRRGLSLHAHYTYSHAMDWNPSESPLNTANFVPGSGFSQGYELGPGSGFNQEYGTSNLDMRHSAAAMAIYETPWKLRSLAGRLGNGWMVSGIGQFHSGLPYTMRTAGSLPKEFTDRGTAIVGLRPGMNGSGGDNRVFGVGNDNRVYNIGRNTYRYPATWKADLRLGKSFDLGHMRQLELLAESFNLLNHENVTELETTGYYIESGSPPTALGAAGTPPTLNFLTGLKINATTGLNTTAFGQPLNINATNFYRERQIQIGLRMRF